MGETERMKIMLANTERYVHTYAHIVLECFYLAWIVRTQMERKKFIKVTRKYESSVGIASFEEHGRKKKVNGNVRRYAVILILN